MILVALLIIFPPLSFLWGIIINVIQNLRENKVSKTFDSIIKDMKEDIDEESYESVNVAIVGNSAYWVADNTFYVASIVNGEIDHDSRQPVNVFEMSNSDLKKMLFILDNLEQG